LGRLEEPLDEAEVGRHLLKIKVVRKLTEPNGPAAIVHD